MSSLSKFIETGQGRGSRPWRVTRPPLPWRPVDRGDLTGFLYGDTPIDTSSLWIGVTPLRGRGSPVSVCCTGIRRAGTTARRRGRLYRRCSNQAPELGCPALVGAKRRITLRLHARIPADTGFRRRRGGYGRSRLEA